MKRSRLAWKIWSRPLLLGVVIVFGLLSALLGGGGAWWVVSWIALALPLVAVVWFALRAGRSNG